MKKVLIALLLVSTSAFSQTVIGTDTENVVLDETGLTVTSEDGAVSYTASSIVKPGNIEYGLPTGTSSQIATIHDVNELLAVNGTNYALYAHTGAYTQPTNSGFSYAGYQGGYLLNTANISATNLTHIRSYIPTFLMPGSKARVIANLPSGSTFRGSLTLPYQLDSEESAYYSTVHQMLMDTSTLNPPNNILYPIYDSGWFDLNGTHLWDQGRVSDLISLGRLSVDFTDLDKSKIIADGVINIKVMYLVPTSGGGGY